ncbi:hypothetical protein SNEBB_005466 [Seison nebaliae]|nr:hypothetical protein SNEBB_005466 [Seison nebaliae]
MSTSLEMLSFVGQHLPPVRWHIHEKHSKCFPILHANDLDEIEGKHPNWKSEMSDRKSLIRLDCMHNYVGEVGSFLIMTNKRHGMRNEGELILNYSRLHRLQMVVLNRQYIYRLNMAQIDLLPCRPQMDLRRQMENMIIKCERLRYLGECKWTEIYDLLELLEMNCDNKREIVHMRKERNDIICQIKTSTNKIIYRHRLQIILREKQRILRRQNVSTLSEIIIFSCHYDGEELVRQVLYNWHSRTFHQRLADKRKMLIESSSRSDKKIQYNFIIFGIDSISRFSAQHHLRKTFKLLEENNFHFFNGIHSNGINTFPNTVALLAGITTPKFLRYDWNSNVFIFPHQINLTNTFQLNSSYVDELPFLWKFLPNYYAVQWQEDWPSAGTFYNHGLRGFHHETFDVPSRKLMMEYIQKSSSTNRLCRHGELSHKFFLRQLESFVHMTQQYDLPFFQYSILSEQTHDDNGGAKNIDKDISLHLKSLLEKEEFSAKTIFLIFSDHGIRNVDYANLSNRGRSERQLPFLAIKLPRKMENIRTILKNKFKLITWLDVYRTLVDVIHKEITNRKKSNINIFHRQLPDGGEITNFNIFENEVPLQRSCTDASIDLSLCTCKTNVTNLHTLKHSMELDKTRKFRYGNAPSNFREFVDLEISSFSRETFDVPDIVQNDKMFKFIMKYDADHLPVYFEGIVLQIENKYLTIYKFDRLGIYGWTGKCVEQYLKPFCICKE